MSLKKYWSKRDFKKTAEPSGKSNPLKRRRAVSKKPGELKYVVQKHAASHLHYDFRLELDGTLKSWAVPKGPSPDPKDKRLAVQVEDHPLDYAGFEGTIPEGEYGAGHVIVWDHGSWVPPKGASAQLKKGRLEFELKGEKLSGKWLLVRTHSSARAGSANWLLIKRSGSGAKPGSQITDERPESVVTGRTLDELKAKKRTKFRKPVARAKQSARARIAVTKTENVRALGRRLAAEVRPQLATLVDRPPSGSAWIHEIKFDGYRAICDVEEDYVGIRTRSGLDWTAKFPWLAESLRALPATSAVIDGEIVALEKSGRTNFGELQAALKNGDEKNLAFFAFDLLALDGDDLREQPLLERKRRLKELISSCDEERIRYSEHWTTSGAKVLEASCGLNLEGIISKKCDEPYLSGRTKDWLKSKCTKAQEFVIGGYIPSQSGARAGFRSLLLGTFAEDQFVYAGRVGTGFSNETLREISKRLAKVATDDCPFDRNLAADLRNDARHVVWCEPKLVANVEFAEWTTEGVLRHASFQSLRADKPARDVVIENPEKIRSSKSVLLEPIVTDNKTRTERAHLRKVEGVTLTHPDKILFVSDRWVAEITKLELANYYEKIAKWILPHISDRPLSLLRCPEGTAGECFFQKHAARGVSRGKTASIKSKIVAAKERGTNEEVIYVESTHDIVALVQVGALELHAWGCHRTKIERPDLIVFDLDPDVKVSWKTVVDTALKLRELLDRLGLKSFVKVTGGKGLHIHVPISPSYGWDEVKSFSKAVSTQLMREYPDRFTTNSSKAKRSGKIFLDYLRNGFGATAIVPYSVRAKPSAPVAMPVSWDELVKLKSPTVFNLKSALKYLARRKNDPWVEYFQLAQKIAILDRPKKANASH